MEEKELCFSGDPQAEIIDALMHLQKPAIEALIYAARQQGMAGGVSRNKYVRQPGEDHLFVPERVVFVKYPEKTVLWGFAETEANDEWLDSLPQYER